MVNKNRLRKCTIIGDKQLEKKRNVPVLTAQFKQKSSVSLTVVGLNNSRSVYNIVSSESCEPKRFVRCGKKIERTTIKSISPLQPEHGFC